MAFIHVDDAVEALLRAAALEGADWQAVNAAPEIATIGQVARTVERLMRRRGLSARTLGTTASEATFEVRSRLALQPRHSLESGLDDVLDYFCRLGRA